MLKDLTHKTMQKRGTFDMDKLKSTFQTTDLNSKTKKKDMDADMMDDALAQDVEGLGAESDDSDFDPEKQDNETKVQVEQWDDEENFVQPNSADLVSSEEEEPSLEKSNEVSKEQVEAS